MTVRAAIIALPVALGILAASASAAPLPLSPLGPPHHAHVATIGGESCAVAAKPAQLTESFINYPVIAEKEGVEGRASVGVSLSPTGRPTRAWLIGSTGNRFLDDAAIESALNSGYVAEEEQCRRVGGDYELGVTFTLP